MSLTQINKAGLDEIALDHVFTIGASGSSAYTFQGEGLNGTVNNPTLYLTRGKTYRFENGSGGHPIRIQSTSGASGTAYNTGVTNNAGSGTVIVEVQHDAPDVLYYQCTSHAAMNGILYITGALADGGVTTAKIADNAVTMAKLDNSGGIVLPANIGVQAANMYGNAIATAAIQNNAVTTTKIADNQITTAKINAGAVTNDKVSSSAAIAGTKISPDFGSQNVATTGNVDADGVVRGNSSNSGKWVRMYGSAGTGRWDIYGHGANLRISDNDNAGSFVVDRNTDLNGGLDVTGNITVSGTVDGVDIATDVARKDGTNMGATTFAVNDADFIVRDSTDSTTNYIWRDHSASKLYLGTPDAVVTPRSHVLPSTDSAYDLGATGTRWANVYADTLYGNGANLTGINTDLVSDTSPQLGGDLLQNGNSIVGYNNEKHKFGNSGNMEIYHTGSSGVIKNTDTSTLLLQANQVAILNSPGNSTRAWFGASNAAQLYYNNAEKFATKDYGVHFTGYKSQSSYVGFHVYGSLNNHGFGTNHGSSITNFDVDYFSPIPMWGSRSVQHGSSYLSFPSYAGGNYLKFTAPVSGVYHLELVATPECHEGGDWVQFGWEKNNTSSYSSYNFADNGAGVITTFERVGGTDAGMGTHFACTRFLAANDYVVLYQQSAAAIRFKANTYYARGTLVS